MSTINQQTISLLSKRVDQPCSQGVSSFLPPEAREESGKMKDPWNEVELSVMHFMKKRLATERN